jgi:hypothetical protein
MRGYSMKRFLLAVAISLCSLTTSAQVAEPMSPAPSLPPKTDRGGGMPPGMMMKQESPISPYCIYEGVAYSAGALLRLPGIRPILECASVKRDGEESMPMHRMGGQGTTMSWRVYRQ